MLSLVILILVFISVALIVIVLFPISVLIRNPNDREEGQGFIYQIKPLLSAIAKLNARIQAPSLKQNLERIMTAAGHPLGVRLTADEFIALSQLAAISFGLTAGLFFGYSILPVTFGMIFGYYFPTLQIKSAKKVRQRSIQRQMPDFLDLLTLTVEAGIDFTSAIIKLLRISKRSPLIDEFNLMNHEMKLGATRYKALKDMALRVDLPDFTAFVSSLVQADRLGASLGPTLRIQSDQMRIRRMQLVEKAGAEASVKLIIPLILFILPAVFIMIFGPTIIPAIMNLR